MAVREYSPLTIFIILVIFLVILILWFWLINTRTSESVRAIGLIRGTGDASAITYGETEIILINNFQSNYSAAVSNITQDIVDAGYYIRDNDSSDFELVKSINFVREGESALWLAFGAWSADDEEDPLTANVVDALLENRLYIQLTADGRLLRGQLLTTN